MAVLQKRVADAEAAAGSLQGRLDDIAKQLAARQAKLDELGKQLADAAQAQDVLAGEALQAKTAATATQAAQAKLAAAVDKASGTVSLVDDDVHVQLVDKLIFKFDDQLSDKGKVVLDHVAAVLKDLPDRQVRVEGHTDDAAVAPPTVSAPKKAAKVAPAKLVAPPKPLTNWELSAARALAVVHYLQDVGHVDPARLAAAGFGQYHPVAAKAKPTGRVEIVLERNVLKP